MEAWILWLTVAAVLLILEVLTQTMWMLCMAIGCAGALVGALCGLAPVGQVVTLAACTGIACLTVMPWFRRWHSAAMAREGRDARTGMDALLGRRAVVTQEIRPGMTGRARIDGDSWLVTAPGSDTTISGGAEVVVTGYDSIVLQVTPA